MLPLLAAWLRLLGIWLYKFAFQLLPVCAKSSYGRGYCCSEVYKGLPKYGTYAIQMIKAFSTIKFVRPSANNGSASATGMLLYFKQQRAQSCTGWQPLHLQPLCSGALVMAGAARQRRCPADVLLTRGSAISDVQPQRIGIYVKQLLYET